MVKCNIHYSYLTYTVTYNILFLKHIAVSKCYDEETKSAYKVDSIWYPEGKCEKRICSRQKESKTPGIKTMK